jgi:hypothetical protein
MVTRIRYWTFSVYLLISAVGQSPMPDMPKFPDASKKEVLWTAY